MALTNVKPEEVLSLCNLSSNGPKNYIDCLLNSSSQVQQVDCFCPPGVHTLSAAYRGYHGYVSLVVCAAGILANAINLAVLTRPALATAPVNRLLTWLAGADMLVMAEYAPFAAYLYLSQPRSHDSQAGATFLLVHMHFSQLLHTASICLTLTLAAWRYITVGYPHLAPRMCTDSRCWLAVVLSLAAPVPLCAPLLFVFEVRETEVEGSPDSALHNMSHFHVGLKDWARLPNRLLELNLWVYALIVKLLPCVVLTAISISLMRTLHTAKQRKKQLSAQQGGSTTTQAANPRRSRAERRADRTTRMLLAVLLLFLATEFPQGVLGLMSGVLGRCFFLRCYQLFGEALDILALLNGAINFILYCAMSRQYRQTFRQLFSPAWSWACALALQKAVPPTAPRSPRGPRPEEAVPCRTAARSTAPLPTEWPPRPRRHRTPTPSRIQSPRCCKRTKDAFGLGARRPQAAATRHPYELLPWAPGPCSAYYQVAPGRDAARRGEASPLQPALPGRSSGPKLRGSGPASPTASGPDSGRTACDTRATAEGECTELQKHEVHRSADKMR